MIQRIQSLWLLLAACCMGLCLMVPVAKYQFDNMPTEGQRVEAQLDLFAPGGADMMLQMDQPVVHYGQRLTGMETWPLVTIVLVCMVIAVVAILLFKRRTLQARLSAFGFILSVVYAFLLFFWGVDHYADLLSAGMGGTQPEVTWHVGAYAPLAAMVFFFLAQRAIKKDEALVKAADRLR
ncbi:MAG: DUF4293 domain-containing protein [Bacteroidales bacterium]|nr:DUF4293 domain-containing protein [Bacteroidales bacterium]